MVNLLTALKNSVLAKHIEVKALSKSSNRANSMGDALEITIRDLFCNSLDKTDEEKTLAYSQIFSYLGNQNNPPDMILRGGDAIEVKKIEDMGSVIALNSSYPKDRLYADSPMITRACRDCEEWKEKDILYCIGVLTNGRLAALWFVYGDCFAAGKETYERIARKISTGLTGLEGVEFSETKELARVNKVDPLGITHLRVRGMWGVENPATIFQYITGVEDGKSFTVNAMLSKRKYDAFPESDKLELESLVETGLELKDVKIKSPNNPANLFDAKLIKFSK